MGHVGEELRLVFRGQCQFGSLVLQGAARLFDFHVLSFDLCILFSELPGFLLEFLIRLLKFFLSRLEFDGQLLALPEQSLGAHGRFDGIQDNADGLGELLEKAQMGFSKFLQRGEFDNRLGLTFKEDGQNDDRGRF